MSPYDMRHYRFERSLSDHGPIQVYEQTSKFRWVFVVAVAALAVLAMVVPS